MRQTRQSASTSSVSKTPAPHPAPKGTTLDRELTSAETNRRDELNNHPHIGWVKPHTVFCLLCAKEIALEKTSLYTPHNWGIHEKRKTHQEKIPKDKIQAEEVDSATKRGKKRKRDSEVKVPGRVKESRTSTAELPIPPKDWKDYEDEVEEGNDNKENENPCNADVESLLPKEVPLVLPVRFNRKSYGAQEKAKYAP